MAALSTIIGAIGLGLGAVGTFVQMDAAQKQSQASIKAEELRKKQMDLENARQRRGVIRQALRARSAGLLVGADQGASGGSGVAGALGGISSQATGNLQGLNQSYELGQGMFAANSDMANAGALASFGGGLSSFGGALISNSQTLGNIGTYFTGKRGRG